MECIGGEMMNPHSYFQYFKVLEAAAALHDATRITPRPTRHVNVGELNEPGDPDPSASSLVVPPDPFDAALVGS